MSYGIIDRYFDNDVLTIEIERYIVTMLLGLLCSSLFFNGSSVVFWTINMLGYVAFLGNNNRVIKKSIVFLSVFYILFTGIIPVIIHSSYMKLTLKSVGTSIGLIVVPLHFALITNLKEFGGLEPKNIKSIFNLLSVIGDILFLFSILMGASDYLRFLTGNLSAYSVNVAGLLKNKNMYGALLGISAYCDLFLTKTDSKPTWRMGLFVIKAIGVAFSFSRAALLYFGIVVILYLWQERKHFRFEWVFFVLGVILLIFFFVRNDYLQRLVYQQILRLDVGDAGRAFGRYSSIKKLGDNLLAYIFGVGYFGIDYLGIDIDNSYYYVFFSGGIVKCLIYIFWIIYSFQHILYLRHTSLLYAHMCFAVAVAYLVYAIFESVPLFELGILNFINMLFMYIIPCSLEDRTEVE